MDQVAMSTRSHRPYVAPQIRLSSVPEHLLCKNKLVGKCFDKTCIAEHGLHAVSHLTSDDTATAPRNLLFENRREAVRSDLLFDDKVPEVEAEPKHDNDFFDITKVKILPTTDEIICLAPVFMPTKKENANVLDLLNVHFRQLRYDNLEPVIDACYAGLQQALWPKPSRNFRLETPRGLRFALLSDVRFQAAQFHQFDGAMYRLSFDCPAPLRGPAFNKSGILEKDKMCSLLVVHKTGSVNIIHLEVKERQATTTTTNSITKSRASVKVCLADKSDTSKVRQMTYYARGLIPGRFFLVDYSNVIPASFMAVLQRLQDCYKVGTFPCANVIAPGRDFAQMHLQVPEYASHPLFQYDASCLKKPDIDVPAGKLRVKPMPGGIADQDTLENLKTYTTLDEGQAVALYENLSRCVAFTQGPPGTGKTFLGVAEAEVLLNSGLEVLSGLPQKPIIVICMTNHALDDFVDSLIKRGITKVVRLGNRSTNEWTAKYQLRQVLNQKRLSREDYQILRTFGKDNEDVVNFASEWAEEITYGPGFRLLQDYLQREEPEILAEFTRLDETADTTTDLKFLTKSSAGYTFSYWLKGGDLDGLTCLLDEGIGRSTALDQKLQELSIKSDNSVGTSMKKTSGGFQMANGVSSPSPSGMTSKSTSGVVTPEGGVTDLNLSKLQQALYDFARRSRENTATHRLWSLNLADRRALFTEWVSKIDQIAQCEAFAEIHRRHQTLGTKKWDWMRKSDARLVVELGIKIVALTATGAARHWNFLNAIEPSTYIIEEASELTEPITIAGLVPSIQHLIKIGDPLQLRPHVTAQVLSGENNKKYRLDESLFERLMSKVPYSKLTMQRRAHPEMANLLRAGDYPYLVDNIKTLSHPTIPGFKHRMFWLTHSLIEDQPDPGSPLAKSFSNKYEARFICEAVKYLIQNRGMRMKQITILTPYNGQVALFLKALSSICKIVLNDEDKQNLLDMGLISESQFLASQGAKATDIQLDAILRITTIDNYQGEENDVIFLSTVRSNTSKKTGFLGNQNRINVAISRARNGFYVVGNASLLEQNVVGWQKTIDVFRINGLIGPQLPMLPCGKHELNTDIAPDINRPQNFENIPKCKATCGIPLKCGHECNAECHAEEMHTDGRMKCEQTCLKTLECGHPCTNKCSRECGPCEQPMQPVVLECGHKVKVNCSTRNNPRKCDFIIWMYPGKCRHVMYKRCSTGEDPCTQPCSKLRPCGHPCPNTCHECEHKDCEQPCDKELECGHTCQSKCHYGDEQPCPPCEQPCRKSCVHGACKLKCSELCRPCTKEGMETHCSHQDIAILCSMPGSRLPCAEPCSLPAPCGIHPCQGLCGEECPEVCDVCDGVLRRDNLFILPCGCTLKVEELDKNFGMDKIYQMNGLKTLKVDISSLAALTTLNCPSCGASAIGSRRYALSYQLHDFNDLIVSLCIPLGSTIWRIMKFVNFRQFDMFENVVKTANMIKPGPLSVKKNHGIISRPLVELREAIMEAQRFRDVEIKPIQEAILSFTEFLGTATGVRAEHKGSMPVLGIPNLPYHLRMERVIIRCKFLIALYLNSILGHLKRQKIIDNHLSIFVDVIKAEAIKEVEGLDTKLDELIAQCRSGNFKRLETEFINQKMSIIALVRKLGGNPNSFNTDLEQVTRVCDKSRSANQIRNNLVRSHKLMVSHEVPIRMDDALMAGRDPETDPQALWRNLGIFERGTLVKCPSGHYYSTASSSGCPECG